MKKFTLLISLTLVFALVLISCGDGSENNNNNGGNNGNAGQDNNSGDFPNDEIIREYIFPEGMDGGGSSFTIAAPTTSWFFYTDIVRDEISGEGLDDAIYNRNSFVEEKFNIEIKEVNIDIESFNNSVRRLTTAGDDAYDAAFCPMFRGTNLASMIGENIFYNLREIPTINLDEEWWNQQIIKEASLGRGDKLFFAACDINIMTLQCLEAVFFNQDMIENLGLTLPYNLVREGKWTFDAFNKYQKDGAQLNGADSFRWENGGNAAYGFISYDNSVNALIDGSGERYVTVDSDGSLRLVVENERFVSVVQKIESMLVVSDGSYLFANTMPDFHYEPIFVNGRSLMTMGELKAADVFREMNDTFGILPIPKYEESQENYYCHYIFATPMAVIPSTNARPEFTGAVLDAMAYLSARDVTPVFFDVTVSQKRLRNEDSIDMLHIIKDSSYIDMGLVYGITNQFWEAIRHSLGEGKTFDIISQTERHRDRMNANIENIIELLG
ncbi:MAG: hypothetical protein FWH10_05550 [Oscillospiraceae bacterium]|nr:hypothetical protein [Oscillospiraceae bacterium]